LFGDNANNKQYVLVVLLKMTFCIFQDKVATADRLGVQVHKLLIENFLTISHTKNHSSRLVFGRVIQKIKRRTDFWYTVLCNSGLLFSHIYGTGCPKFTFTVIRKADIFPPMTLNFDL